MTTNSNMQNKQQSSPLYEALKHPVFILLLGTLISSVIIPYIVGRSAHARQLEELRAQSALSAVKNSDDVDRQLNILLTTFESFWKDIDEAKREDQKAELRTKIYSLYEEFDRTAWWWFDESRQQAALLGLFSDQEAKEAEEISAKYRKSLTESAAAVDSAWQISLRQSPPPTGVDAAKVLAHARERLEKARVERYQLLEQFTGLLCRRR
jgi:hypothetical protein